MSYQLVIAEKPSVARSIAGVIGATEKHDGYLQGNGYLVSWCIGHLVSFADAGRYDERFKKWRYEDLPILPETWQYIIRDEKKQQFDILRSLMERPDVTGLVCATDAGREGELIFRFVYQMAGCEKPFKRLWISSMEDSAIRILRLMVTQMRWCWIRTYLTKSVQFQAWSPFMAAPTWIMFQLLLQEKESTM